MVREHRNIVDALPQRGDQQGDGADAEEQVAAESLVPHENRQILMGGRQQPDVNPPVAHVSQAPELLFLEHLEDLGLDLEIDVADFVQK